MEVLTLERTLTELDHVRITNLVHRHKGGKPAASAALPIERVLDEADIVHWRQMPPDVVTMHSLVLLKDTCSGACNELRLCYPDEADASAGCVSVLSPVGWSLLGQKVGTLVRWPTPSGVEGEGEILDVLFQPEASGDPAM